MNLKESGGGFDLWVSPEIERGPSVAVNKDEKPTTVYSPRPVPRFTANCSSKHTMAVRNFTKGKLDNRYRELGKTFAAFPNPKIILKLKVNGKNTQVFMYLPLQPKTQKLTRTSMKASAWKWNSGTKSKEAGARGLRSHRTHVCEEPSRDFRSADSSSGNTGSPHSALSASATQKGNLPCKWKKQHHTWPTSH